MPTATARRRTTGRTNTAPTAGTLDEWLRYVGARPYEPDWIPFWPPDAFAIGAAFLRRTGAYVALVNGSLSRKFENVATTESPEQIGRRWRQTLSNALKQSSQGVRLRDACPAPIKYWWSKILAHCDLPLLEAAMIPEVVQAACELCVISDAACGGIGVDTANDPFLAMAQAILDHNERRSFCLVTTPDKLAVLGKQHTPQRGCTIRSLTHHLALYSPTEIGAFWAGPYSPEAGDLDVLNLLLLPWPTEVQASDFRMAPLSRSRGTRFQEVSAHRYFDYTPKQRISPTAMAAKVQAALATAKKHATHVHGIVFPELALTLEQFREVERVAIRNRSMLISGLRIPDGRSSAGLPMNMSALQPLGLTAVPKKDRQRRSKVWEETLRTQLKHHRWCLDRNQILQYGLGGRLPASRECWERTAIGSRTVNFVTLGSWLTMCVLVCEDLARQDPVADVIRAVGPNMVFALLMDGPQLRNRWPSRYASVLAEDPGSSVLTITSLGMAKRSRRREEEAAMPDRSGTIALWRDAIYGEREISIENGHDACVLSLVCRTTREFTIDGRDDNEQAHFPVFAGVHSFSTAARPGSRQRT